MAQAKELIEKFWDIQDGHDYTKMIDLFADDAVFQDPVIGRVDGKENIRALLARLTEELADKKMYFEVVEIAGDEQTAWSRWIWKRPQGDIEGVGLYKVENGLMTYYRDFFAVPDDAP